MCLSRDKPKITIRNLDFFYGDQQALFDVSMAVPQNEITAIIGPSGCGKSTLLRVLNRMYDHHRHERASGEVTLDGQDILGRNVDLSALRRRIGMVFQAPSLFPMSIFENVAYGVRLEHGLSRDDVAQRVESALTRADLWQEIKGRLPETAGSLSGGQQQRLCIARALAVHPEVLLLDEPTGALDPISMQAIEELIIDLKRDVTMLLVTHNMLQARRCADQVAFFYLGKLVEIGSTEHVFSAPIQLKTKDYVEGKFG